MKTHSTYDSDRSIMAPGMPYDGTRPGYALHHQIIHSSAQFKSTLRAGAYTWPGCYPLYFICEDGGPLCFDCARKESRIIISSLRNNLRDGWSVSACDVNYDDSDLICSHCNGFIESAYA